MKDKRLTRLDPTRWRIENPFGVEAALFANDDVPVESSAVQELLELLELQADTQQLSTAVPEYFPVAPELTQVAVTPDFHKGSGVPIGTVLATRGFVVPAAIGNDINCGMRLHLTSLKTSKVQSQLAVLEDRFRHLYFQGGRNIAMNRIQREALFKNGLTGLCETVPRTQQEGLWAGFHRFIGHDLPKVERKGSLLASQTRGLDDFLGGTELSRDGQIGSIGGGNHFVEIQFVDKILDRATAHAWGITPGMLTVMVHTGSVSIGHLSGSLYRERVKKQYPKGRKHPRNGVFVLPEQESTQQDWRIFWDGLNNAANFAFANRMFLALMALQGLEEVCGELDAKLLYDAPHNLVWPEKTDCGTIYIHRKGACPARGMEQMSGTPFEFHGEPVLVPGSMGASSFILRGLGNAASLQSASHGAGRILSRGDALQGHEKEFAEFLKNFRVVTPIDFKRQDVRQRRDIMDKKLEDIKKEAPFAYKGIGPIVKTLEQAGIAAPVAELHPLMTIKG